MSEGLGGAGAEGFGAEEVGDAAGAGGARFGGGGGGGFVDGGAVVEGDGAAGDGGDAVAGDEDAGEVEGVGGGDGDGGFGRRGRRRRVRALRRDSTASGRAYCSPKGPETKRPPRISPRASRRRRMGSEVAPLGGVGFAGEEIAEEDAVAAEEDAGVGVEGGVGWLGGGDGGGVAGLRAGLCARRWSRHGGGTRCVVAEQRPAAGGGAGGGAFAEAGGGGLAMAADLRRGSIMARSWSKPSAEARPAVASSQSAVVVCSLVRPERRWRSAVKAAPRVAEERADLLGFGREGLREDGFVDALGGEGVVQPVGGLAEVEGDGRGGGGDDAAGCGCLRLRDQAGCGEMRPQPTTPARQRLSSQRGS